MLHRILFDAANMADSANLGAFLRMGSTGALASYSSKTLAGNVTFNFVDGDVTPASDSILESAHGLEMGDIVRLSTSGTLPAGLAAATDYFVIRVDANNFKLAASLADAEAGIAVDITAAAGGGTHTLTEQERVHAALDVNVVNAVNATISGTVPVTATDLDIRDLAFATDKVDVSGSEVSLDSATLAALENITVSATDLDIRDLAFATDSVDVSGSSVSITGSVAVTATDLDIRDLTHATDSIKIGDGTDFLAIDASGNIGVTDAGGSLTVDAVNLDIRDLTAASDSVASWLNDGSGNAITSTGGALDVNIANAGEISIDFTHNTAIAASAESVTTSSGALIASPLANRENVWVYNHGNKVVYLGQSGVTTGTGFPIFPGSLLEAKIGAAVAIHAVAESGTQDVRVLQAS
jgi:hypothetical protein